MTRFTFAAMVLAVSVAHVLAAESKLESDPNVVKQLAWLTHWAEVDCQISSSPPICQAAAKQLIQELRVLVVRVEQFRKVPTQPEKDLLLREGNELADKIDRLVKDYKLPVPPIADPGLPGGKN